MVTDPSEWESKVQKIKIKVTFATPGLQIYFMANLPDLPPNRKNK